MFVSASRFSHVAERLHLKFAGSVVWIQVDYSTFSSAGNVRDLLTVRLPAFFSRLLTESGSIETAFQEELAMLQDNHIQLGGLFGDQRSMANKALAPSVAAEPVFAFDATPVDCANEFTVDGHEGGEPLDGGCV